MDKKTGIILGIISAVIVVLVAVVFVMDANTEKVDSNTILTINDVQYSIDDFITFSKLTNHENGDINKNMTEDEALSMLDSFLLRKLYYDAAVAHEVKLDEDSISKYEDEYGKDEATFLTANISKDDYKKYEEEKELAQKLQYNFSDYYTLPDETYNSVKDSFKKENMYNTYTFRMMTIPYEEETSGDDASGDETNVLESGDKEDLSREAQLKVAEDVLARIRSGEDFSALAKEYGSTRLSFKGNEYVLINGDVEYATTPLLASKLGSDDLYEAVTKLSSGDSTDVIEDTKYTTFQIVKLEGVEEGFVGEGEKELKEVLLNEYANDIISEGARYEMNQGAFVRMLYKK